MENKFKTIGNLIENLKDTFAEKLVSVILYGSCATSTCENNFSDINLIVVIDNLCATDLKKASAAIKDFSKTKNPLPLFMDKDEWFNSCDVYPIEYLDIKERYSILYGEDIVKPLVIEKTNLRLQCEHEVKNLLIKLRQNYLAKNGNLKAIEEILKKSSKNYFALFRAILRLTQDNMPLEHAQVIDTFSEKVKIDKEVFLKLLEFRESSNRLGAKTISKNEYETTIQKLIDSTNEVLKYIDKF